MFKDKVVLITGSSRGIGKSTAISFAKQGADIVVNCKSSIDKANSVVEEIKRLGKDAILVKADISNLDEVRKLKNEIKKYFKNLDVLVNNAGILKKEDVNNPNWNYWDDILETNLKGLAMCSYELSSIMNNGSSILNLASVWGLDLPAYDANAYSATKAAVVNLTKSLALQLAPKIRVNAVAPSIVATEMMHEDDTETKEWIEKNIPLGRAAEPSDISDLILFLSSEKAKFITGETVKVDGGITLKI